MDYLSSVKELRKKVPVSISEAIELLKKHGNDVALCEEIFMNNRIMEICQQTNCSVELARQRFTESQFDIVKALHRIREEFCDHALKEKKIMEICQQTGCSEIMALKWFTELRFDAVAAVQCIREELYDRQYRKPDFLTRKKLDIIYEWLKFEDWENLDVALETKWFETVVEVLQQMENRKHVYIALKTARERLDMYMKNRNGNVDDFIKRTNALRKDSVYIECQEIFEQNKGTLERELERHNRNIEKPNA